MAQILIVEDDKTINELIHRSLTLVGHQCRQCYSGEDAVALIAGMTFDLVLLDVLLPGMDGFSVMKKFNDMPVIFLTALGELSQRVRGLNLGADDYIVKPFETIELLARVQAVLRRTHKEDTRFELDDTLIDLAGRKVFVCGRETSLTPQEFTLLDVFDPQPQHCAFS